MRDLYFLRAGNARPYGIKPLLKVIKMRQVVGPVFLIIFASLNVFFVFITIQISKSLYNKQKRIQSILAIIMYEIIILSPIIIAIIMIALSN